jgi:hypothetical protein
MNKMLTTKNIMKTKGKNIFKFYKNNTYDITDH